MISNTIPQVQRAIRAHELVVFYVLACAFSWAAWSLMVYAGDSPVAMAASMVPVFGPAVGALLTLKLSGRSLRAWVRSLGPVAGSVRWSLAAVVLAAALLAVTTGAYLLAGGVFTAPTVTVSALVVAFVLTLTLGGGLEELGWRGYALPRLQQRWSPVVATLVVGFGWALWHLPLFVLPGAQNADQPFWLFTAAAVVLSFVFTWLYNVAGGRVLPAILLHGLYNTTGLLYPFAADTSVALNFGAGIAAAVSVATVLLFVTKGRLTGEAGPVLPRDVLVQSSRAETKTLAD
ncbi:Membrane protease YdiL, CAAX protease family [Halogranum rubrum]|uniref:Membrane protease YdiL, CAAX protease family n=1 Tax=Halogranum rubrum TaxID=553466 RepID=A0A1I4AUZ9_9EURY|nr:CPBP family intramembrane glutamic endopeptidase [Halogranum rubrum]SFK60368.1 Membrane protease YdiL, CAAX protease family [Halogranum rubrum]